MSRFPVYSQRFFAAGSLTAGAYGPIVPAGVIWVVRDIDVVALATTGADMVVRNQTGGSLFYFSLANAQTPGPNYSWRGRQIYAEGEQLEVFVFHGTFDVAISGYQLTTP